MGLVFSVASSWQTFFSCYTLIVTCIFPMVFFAFSTNFIIRDLFYFNDLELFFYVEVSCTGFMRNLPRNIPLMPKKKKLLIVAMYTCIFLETFVFSTVSIILWILDHCWKSAEKDIAWCDVPGENAENSLKVVCFCGYLWLTAGFFDRMFQLMQGLKQKSSSWTTWEVGLFCGEKHSIELNNKGYYTKFFHIQV